MATISRNKARKQKHFRIRHHISGTMERPRLNVFKSLNNFEAQLIDDVSKTTIAFASTKQLKLEKSGNIAAAILVGEAIGQKMVDLGIKTIVFDRAGYIYHGKVKAFAEVIRAKGVKF